MHLKESSGRCLEQTNSEADVQLEPTVPRDQAELEAEHASDQILRKAAHLSLTNSFLLLQDLKIV